MSDMTNIQRNLSKFLYIPALSHGDSSHSRVFVLVARYEHLGVDILTALHHIGAERGSEATYVETQLI